MLTGDNGILTQAQNAKNQTEKASIIEQAQTDILGIQAGGDTVLTQRQLKRVLDNYFKDVSKEVTTDDILTTTDGKYQIPVSDIYNGELATEPPFNATNLTIGEAKIEDKYGQIVKDYTVQAGEMQTNKWRLFYQDSEYTYLITDEGVGESKLSEYVNYNSGEDVSLIGQKLNPKLIEAGTFFTQENENPNIKATAYLTDQDVWDEFKDENGDAVFAIGSPTVELFVKSFNATHDDTNQLPECNVGEYGYNLDEINYSKFPNLKTDDRYGIYNNGDSCWLASPLSITMLSIDSEEKMIIISDRLNGFFYGTINESNVPVRPLVCIPTSVFNDKYLSSLADE